MEDHEKGAEERGKRSMMIKKNVLDGKVGGEEDGNEYEVGKSDGENERVRKG